MTIDQKVLFLMVVAALAGCTGLVDGDDPLDARESRLEPSPPIPTDASPPPEPVDASAGPWEGPQDASPPPEPVDASAGPWEEP